jgi:hypothetical protein
MHRQVVIRMGVGAAHVGAEEHGSQIEQGLASLLHGPQAVEEGRQLLEFR